MVSSINFQFCFDISLDEKLTFLIPSAYIVNNSDKIIYVDKVATPLIIESLGINQDDLGSSIKNLLQIIEVLKPEKLLRKFDKNPKSKKTFLDLLNDKTFGKIINSYIDSKVDQFLTIVKENNYPLSLNLKSSKEFYKFQVATQNLPLRTKLLFDKNELGINYTLQIIDNLVPFFPSDKKIDIILNEPSWLIIDAKLFQLQDLNSNKIKPFLSKKIVEIKSELVAEYFSKFIKDIVKKVDIETNGFDVLQKNQIVSCKLNLVEDFFKKKYNLELLFDYGGFLFANHSNKNSHSSLINNQNSQIQVIQFKRNFEQELVFEEKLFALGFQKNNNSFFTLSNYTDEYEVVQYLIENSATLKNEGFLIENLAIANKKIQSNIATIAKSSQENSDWFDLKMIIKCGGFEINFSDIIPNIKINNQFYKLPDETYFLIPATWMTKYVGIANFAKIKNNNLTIPKSNYTLLENLELKTLSLKANDKITFQQSHLLHAALRPYQIDGVKWLLKNHNSGLGSCLADDMGLGKTLQTLATLVAVQENQKSGTKDIQEDLFTVFAQKTDYLKALIVAPSSLVFNWYNESRKFTPHFRRIQYIGNDRKLLGKKLDKYDLIFTSYAILTRDIAIFEKYNFNYLIIDESQQIKNRESKIFKAINEVNTNHKISLSGTPIENSLDDLYSQMQFINPDILGDYKFFLNYFKIPIEKYKNSDKLLELKNIINPFILRRTKEQVLDDLPELSEQIIYCNMEKEQEKLYETEKSKARNDLLKIDAVNNKINVLNVLMKLRQLSNHPKLWDKNSSFDSGKFLTVINYIQTLLQSGQKILIFSSFVSHLQLYEDWCKENNIFFCKLTGDTIVAERENQIKQFQENYDIKIFFISLKSGGVGLNLTSASFVILLDPWWNPFAERQAIARAHRIGQKNKVNAIRFISKNTIEEKIILLQEKKILLSDSILELDNIPQDFDNNLSFLLE